MNMKKLLTNFSVGATYIIVRVPKGTGKRLYEKERQAANSRKSKKKNK